MRRSAGTQPTTTASPPSACRAISSGSQTSWCTTGATAIFEVYSGHSIASLRQYQLGLFLRHIRYKLLNVSVSASSICGTAWLSININRVMLLTLADKKRFSCKFLKVHSCKHYFCAWFLVGIIGLYCEYISHVSLVQALRC